VPAEAAVESPARAIAQLSRLVESALGDELSLSQYRLLAFLAHGELAASALASALEVRRPSITGVVDGLVKRGFVARRPNDRDRRRIDHVLTPAGAAALGDADERAEKRLHDVFAKLPPAVADDTWGALHQLHDAMRARFAEKRLS
jgi:long-chain acyl-CoA synthetase